MNPSDLESRVLRMLDGELPAEEVTALEAELREQDDARETYRMLVRLHSALETRYESESVVEQMRVVPIDLLVTRQRRRIVKASLVAAAAAIVVAGVTLVMIMAPKPPIPVASFRTTSDSAFSLTHDGDGEAPMGNVLVKGSRLRLMRGTMEGAFASGVRVVIGAPCDLRVLEDDRVALAEGVAWFHVPTEAVGFAVESPELVIVDLGTEFGVIAAAGERDEIHVLAGSVEVAVRHEGGPHETLLAGQARRVDRSGPLRAIAVEGGRFLAELPEARAIAIANHSFEADVLPRDGDPTTRFTGADDYNKEMVPTGWIGFDDGDGGTSGTRGILSTAPDSGFHSSLARTPDRDENDQLFFSAARDLYQVLSETLQPNTTYTLKVDIGDRALPGAGGRPGNPSFRLGTGTHPGEGLLSATARQKPAQIDGAWVTWTTIYQTGSSPPRLGEPLRIELTSGSQVGWFDNVRLTVSP